MQLFYESGAANGNFTLSKSESTHCVKVLRMKPGDILLVADGKGNIYKTEIVKADPSECRVKTIDVQHESYNKSYLLHIAVSLTKNINRFEWFLEKATETGINEITPLICEHSERKLINTGRMQKLLISAMKQSQRANLPVLNEPVLFSKFVETDLKGQKFIAYRNEASKNLKDICKLNKTTTIMIGPEGDFSDSEITSSFTNNFIPVNLGKSRLRTETAALIACCTVNLLNE